ncbi:MAG: hypothetical protein Q8M07_19020 [Prosthecobacter sp.]|nr:hypothetical protein [Prosthecobacter sp.]
MRQTRLMRVLAVRWGCWHVESMPATVTPSRKTAAQKFRDLPPVERKTRITAFLDDVGEFWKGRPSTGSVDFLLKLRRGGLKPLQAGVHRSSTGIW